MNEKIQLIVNAPVKGGPMVYQCSLCGQMFPLADEQTPKQAMAAVWAAFQKHVREYHPAGETSSMGQ